MALEERDIPCESPRRKNFRPATPKRTTPLRLLPWKSGKCAPQGNFFGTPSYPSPLDRIPTGRRERAKQLGLETPTKYADFELNQSFPGTVRPQQHRSNSPEMGDFKRSTLETLKANTQNSVSFAAGGSKGGFGYSPNMPHYSRPMGGNWVYYNFVGGGQTGLSFPTAVQNPNKAVFTVDGKSGEILMANKMACRLLGVNGSRLCGKHLCDFLKDSKKWYATKDSQIDSSGELVNIAGKVVELVNNEGKVIPVSVWVHCLTSNDQPRHVVVLEPVSRTVATVVFDQRGIILAADDQMATLHGYESKNSLEGLSISQLLPFLSLPPVDANSLKLSKEIKKQNTTARTCDGITFPATVQIEVVEPSSSTSVEKESQKPLFKAILWVFANISGLVAVFPDGSIHSCNDNFALTLFGYDQAQLVGKNITVLIPSFYDDLEFLDTESILLPPLGDDDDDDENSKFIHPPLRRNDSCRSYGTPRPANPMGKQIELMIEDVSEVIHSLALDSPSRFALRNSSVSEPPTRSPSADCFLGTATAILPSGSCHAQLNSATCGERALSFGYVPSAPADPKRPRDDLLRSTSCANRTAEKELEREKLRLPIKSDVDPEGSVTPTVDSNLGSLLGSPVTATATHHQECASTPNDVHERPPKFVMNRYGSLESLQSIPEGSYFGLGMHKNGSDMAIIYQIKKVELDDGHVLYCLWISRDPDEISEGGRPCCSLIFQSSLFNNSSKLSIKTHFSEHDSLAQHDSTCSYESVDCEEGSYNSHYTTLKQIGKGAFGFVKMAYRKSDRLLVVTKFIEKSFIYDENMVYDSAFDKQVPLEISLLMTLKHPNIVQVVDIFENKIAYQLVLEKHGSGMDLFEFIDREPTLDEPLTSYIFRQVVSAISYLHKLNIVHRDIKDENIILDEKFHIKLIDFGSATFMAQDRYFSTFCGTTEYCSPEVLQGNKGPELEMWAMGITLYVLIYGETAFASLEESVLGVLHPPFAVSQSLMQLLTHMLDPDPSTRCTVTEAADHPWTNQPVSPSKYRFEDVVCATNEEVNPRAFYDPEMSQSLNEMKVLSPVKSPRCDVASEGKNRRSTSLSNTSDECYEEQDSYS